MGMGSFGAERQEITVRPTFSCGSDHGNRFIGVTLALKMGEQEMEWLIEREVAEEIGCSILRAAYVALMESLVFRWMSDTCGMDHDTAHREMERFIEKSAQLVAQWDAEQTHKQEQGIMAEIMDFLRKDDPQAGGAN